MKKKLLVLGVSLFLVGCSNGELKKEETESVENISSVQEKNNPPKTTKEVQILFNTVVDDNVKFLELYKDDKKGQDVELVVSELKKNIENTDKIIESLELVDNPKIDSSTLEVLALAKSFRNYYGLVSKGESDKSQTELLIAYGSINEIAERCFNGELPPYMMSLEK